MSGAQAGRVHARLRDTRASQGSPALAAQGPIAELVQPWGYQLT